MRLLLSSLCALVLFPPCAAADVSYEFLLGNQTGFSINGNEYTRTAAGLSTNGVTFDATISVVGFDSTGAASDVSTSSVGLGVSGTGSALIDPGEYLRASVSIANVSGGTVNFEGFEATSLSNFEAAEIVILSLDNLASTTGDNQTLSGASGTDFVVTLANPTLIHGISDSGSMRFNSFTARFSAVPEPTGLILSALLGGFCTVLRRKRSLASYISP